MNHEGPCSHAKEFEFHLESSGESLKDVKLEGRGNITRFVF